MRMELISLYEQVVRQRTVINKIEEGGYSNGIKAINIPIQEKKKMFAPSRENFPLLYSTIHKSKYLTTGKSTKNETNKAHENYLKQWKKSNTLQTKRSSIQNQGGSIDINVPDENKFKPLCDAPPSALEKLSKKEQEIYTKDLLEKWKKSDRQETKYIQTVEKQDEIREKTGISDLKTIKVDLDKYKQLYQNEIKISRANRALIEKQKKIIKHMKSTNVGHY